MLVGLPTCYTTGNLQTGFKSCNLHCSQRLTSAAGAADASTAPTTVGGNSGSLAATRRRADDRQEERPQQGTLVIPLAASIDKLTAAHERMSEERVKEDREQEKHWKKLDCCWLSVAMNVHGNS